MRQLGELYIEADSVTSKMELTDCRHFGKSLDDLHKAELYIEDIPEIVRECTCSIYLRQYDTSLFINRLKDSDSNIQGLLRIINERAVPEIYSRDVTCTILLRFLELLPHPLLLIEYFDRKKGEWTINDLANIIVRVQKNSKRGYLLLIHILQYLKWSALKEISKALVFSRRIWSSIVQYTFKGKDQETITVDTNFFISMVAYFIFYLPEILEEAKKIKK